LAGASRDEPKVFAVLSVYTTFAALSVYTAFIDAIAYPIPFGEK